MDWKRPENNALVTAILTLQTSEEVRSFLRDLLTEGEIEEFVKRFQAANMLSSGMPYSAIVKQTGLSSTTVARVSKWLNGKEGGYRSVINKMHHRSASRARGLS